MSCAVHRRSRAATPNERSCCSNSSEKTSTRSWVTTGEPPSLALWVSGLQASQSPWQSATVQEASGVSGSTKSTYPPADPFFPAAAIAARNLVWQAP